MIPEETKGGKEAEVLETEELEDPPTQVSGGAEGIMSQETTRELVMK